MTTFKLLGSEMKMQSIFISLALRRLQTAMKRDVIRAWLLRQFPAGYTLPFGQGGVCSAMSSKASVRTAENFLVTPFILS